MFYVYIIFSATANKYYVGSCQNVQQRLDDHLNSRSKYTKMVKDWEFTYTESFETRSQAYQREMEIKKKKSRVFIENLIHMQG
jgi:putative endonuclease